MPTQPYKTDQAWIDALKQGKLDAWGSVPNPEAKIPSSGLLGQLYKWGRQKNQDDDLAKDIALEAATQISYHLATFREEGHFDSWLRQIFNRVLYRRAPAFEYKLRAKLTRWLKTYEQRGLEQKSFTKQAIQELPDIEQKILALLHQGQNTEQISASLGLTLQLTRACKNRAISALLDNQSFMSMLIRVGNQPGAKKDKLAANIIAAFQELKETSIDTLTNQNQRDGNPKISWEILAQSGSESETDVTDLMALFYDCLDQLTPKRRAAMSQTLDYRVHNQPDINMDEAIAQQLNITPQLLRIRRFQARKQLRKCMGLEN